MELGFLCGMTEIGLLLDSFRIWPSQWYDFSQCH